MNVLHLVALNYLANRFQAAYIIDNDIDVRIVAHDNEFCNIGRIEFHNGTNWGSFTDCSKEFTLDIASSVCQTLGWDYAQSFNHGPYQDNMGPTHEVTAYTNIYCPFMHKRSHKHDCYSDHTEHNDLLDCDTCLQCQLSNDLDVECPNISVTDLHRMYDIYVTCSNQNTEANSLSNLYTCSFTNTQSSNSSFESCSDAFDNNGFVHEDDTHGHMWKVFVVIGICVGFVLCAVLYCRSTARMRHKKFTEAYMANLENDDDILLDTKPTPPQTSKYTSLADKRESLLD